MLIRVLIFIVSIFICLSFLALERFAGIKWNYHPDAETYIYESPIVALTLLENGVFNVFNNSYYLICFIFKSNINALIGLNIIVFSLTNVIIYTFLKTHMGKRFNWIAFWVLVLIPYRLHLSVHVLKDSIIIFFLTLIISKNVLSKVSMFFILLIRIFSVFYFTILIPTKFYRYILPFVILLTLFYNNQALEFLSEKNELEMTFREFDKVPTFSEFGIFGIFVRAIVWPFLVLTGLFIVISPSVAFLPVALGSCIVQVWSLKYLGKFGFTLQVFFSCFLIALFVSGFTSYLRYTFPLVLVIPLTMHLRKDF